MNRHHALLSASFVCGLALPLHQIAKGYLVDPGLLFLLSLALCLPVTLTPCLVFLTYSVRAVRRPKETRRWKHLAVAILPLALLRPANPVVPSALDAFTYRVGQFPSEEYHELARAIREEAGPGEHLLDRWSRQEERYAAFREGHAILKVTEWPAHMSLWPDQVVVGWGSSKTSTFEIIITKKGAAPRRMWGERVQLYEDVYLNVFHGD